jgi:hypothetical protein
VRHGARDLWRDWLANPAGANDLARIVPGGPLARSHRLRGGSWRRYDQIWAADDFRVDEMSYDYDISCSDHAIVTAAVRIATTERACRPDVADGRSP